MELTDVPFDRNNDARTCSEVNITSRGKDDNPFVFPSGITVWRATATAYKFDMAPPAKRHQRYSAFRTAISSFNLQDMSTCAMFRVHKTK